jgi:hypothetical protein
MCPQTRPIWLATSLVAGAVVRVAGGFLVGLELQRDVSRGRLPRETSPAHRLNHLDHVLLQLQGQHRLEGRELYVRILVALTAKWEMPAPMETRRHACHAKAFS